MVLKPTAAKIVAAFRKASDEQQVEGRDWYVNAHAVAASLCPTDPRQAAGVMAALSPRTSWPRNLELAARAYAEGFASGSLSRSCAAADAILGGTDPLVVLNGPKVRSFFTLIADPTDATTVCVDRHAIDVAVGKHMEGWDRSMQFPLNRKGLYERFAGFYRSAAKTIGDVRPAQVQAVTWVTWREQFAGV